MTTHQKVWPGFPLTVPYEVTVDRPSRFANVLVPPVIPRFYHTVTENPSSKNRRFFLDRAVYDLVSSHSYLSLTDPKLLDWYLCLSPEDRKIIQGDGGFRQFLQRHPALELSVHHVYVKYNIGNSGPAQSFVAPNRQTSRTSKAKNCRCGNIPFTEEMPYTHPELERLPSNVRATLTLLGCSCSKNETQKHPREKISLTEHHLQGAFQTALNSPRQVSPRSQLYESWQIDKSSSSAAVGQMSFAVDMELERCGWGREPEKIRDQRANANVTLAEGAPLQSDWSTMKGESLSVQTVDDEASLSFEAERHGSILEVDESILLCLASEDVKAQNTGVQSGPVSSETLKRDQPVINMNPAERSTSPLLNVTTCDMMVGTEPAPCTSDYTQTEDRGTSEKHIITEVHMADLDYLAEEFIKLRMAKEELREHKKKSLGCKLRLECECVRRAQQAELCLLALQYSMCTQHCWRLYCTSTEGGQLIPQPKNPPANIVSVLQKLECDYNEMRDKILRGVHLEELKPLSVDSEKITTGKRYTPSQIIGDVLESVPSWSSQEPQKPEASGADNQTTDGCQQSQRQDQMKKHSKAGRAVSLISQNRDATTRQDLTMNTQGQPSATDLDSEEETKSSVLCVSNLPSHVTESDLMQTFEKYSASEVRISALNKDLRVAIVTISGHQSVEAAVRELNGCSLQGHTLHVEHITERATGESHSQASAPITTKPQPSELVHQPPLSSSINIRKVVCVSPTAKGTFVPQHFGTMGSFDTLIADLTQHHPGVGRQKIMDTLMELKAEHRGALIGLPLRTIQEMTSELLTSDEGAMQL